MSVFVVCCFVVFVSFIVCVGGCDPLALCTPTTGSRICGNCPSGYTGTGDTQCNDINECAQTPSPCDVPLSTCSNQPGFFTCSQCPAGYTGSGYTKCTENNVCLTNNGSYCVFVFSCCCVVHSFVQVVVTYTQHATRPTELRVAVCATVDG